MLDFYSLYTLLRNLLQKYTYMFIISSEIYSFIYILDDEMDVLVKLLETGKTVFSLSELKILLKKENNVAINLLLQPLKKKGILLNLSYGIWSLKHYDTMELASKLRSGSYISFETVLQDAGVIFQHYDHTIFLATNNSFVKTIGPIHFEYHKIKDTILRNSLWILNFDNKYMIASRERAICDMVYLYKNIVFDNLRPLNADKIEEISLIYPKTTVLLLKQLVKNVRSIQT